MPSLFITASDTNVGKTYITANLLKLLLDQGYKAQAIKPIETGFNYSAGVPTGSDVDAYQQINPTNTHAPAYYFDYPASPHYSARLENRHIGIDELENYCRQHSEQADITLIEGAGGLLVPFNDEHNFTHLIKRLKTPIVLVIHNQLGAINQALTNIELCDYHGIDIACVVMNQTETSDDNHLALENIALVQSKTNAPVIQIDKNSDYQSFADRFAPVLESLAIVNNITENNPPPSQGGARGGLTKDETLSTELNQKLDFDKNHLWHPYTSMTEPLKAYHVSYAEGKHIYLSKPLSTPNQENEPQKQHQTQQKSQQKTSKLLEGMGSWWAVNNGYNRDDLNKSAIRQINQFSHVMFGGLTHDPAIALGKTLIDILPAGLERIFYCDSGSVSVEVAIKMALQYQQNIDPQKTKILTPLGGYHGDTFGAMSVCDPVNGMHGLFRNMLAEQIHIPRPDCPYQPAYGQSADQPFNPVCLEPLKQALADNQDIAAVIIEPLVQGAGGMWFYHPQYLKQLRQLCDQHGILLIFDEIATGFGRTGAMFASDLAEVTPDILCLGKALTAGFTSFACTVTSAKVAKGISQNGNPFMHGPTYMGNPLACAVAKTAIDSLINSDWQNQVHNIAHWLTAGLAPCRDLPAVADVRVLGAIGVVELFTPLTSVDVQRLQAYFIEQGIWLRPFGKLIYTMPHFNFNQTDINKICQAIHGGIVDVVQK